MNKQLMSFLALAVLALPANATESEDFVRRGARSFSAFQCVAAANLAGLKAEELHLTNLGLAEGKAFLEARDAGKATPQDIYRGLPQGFYNVMSGPTHDFILGRVFEVASSWVSSELLKDNPLPDTVRVLALASYQKQNCGLL